RCFHQTVHDKIWAYVGVSKRLVAVAGGHEQRRRSHPVAQGDVAGFVANDKRLARIEAQILHRLLHQSWLGFATLAMLLRPVRAHVNAIQSDTSLRQQVLQPGVDRLQTGHVYIAPGNGRLVGHYSQHQTVVPQPPQALYDARQEFNAVGVQQVVTFRIDCPVAVEEYDTTANRDSHTADHLPLGLDGAPLVRRSEEDLRFLVCFWCTNIEETTTALIAIESTSYPSRKDLTFDGDGLGRGDRVKQSMREQIDPSIDPARRQCRSQQC